MGFGGDDIHTLNMADVPLCVECFGCGRRVVLEPEKLIRGRSSVHAYTTIVSLSKRLVCRECGARAMRAFRPKNREHAMRFLKGEE